MKPCQCLQRKIQLRAQQRLYQFSHLERLKDKTFDAFKPRGKKYLVEAQADSLERAYNHALHYAHSLKGWLLIQGRYGCGKTHLAAAIANYVVVELGIPTLFITVPDLLDSLRYAYSDPDITFEEQFEQVRQVDLLVLDDFGTQNATPWAQEKLFQLINYRYINQLPLVVTTNLTWESIDGRIRSRFKDPELVTRVTIFAPDYRNAEDDKGQPEISSLDLLANRTFDNFDQRENENLPREHQQTLAYAFQQAQIFAEEPHGWLVFIGGNGCGKTHLAAAIANQRTGKGYPPVFIQVADLLDHLRSTFAPTSVVRFDQVFEEVRSTDLLILDDLVTSYISPWAREKLYQIIDYRYFAELPTVITSSEDMEQMDMRIRSRFNDVKLCKVVHILAPAYRGGQSQNNLIVARSPKSSKKYSKNEGMSL